MNTPLPTRETLAARAQEAWLAWKRASEEEASASYTAYLLALEAWERGPVAHPDELQEPHQWKNQPEPQQSRPDAACDVEYPHHRADQ